jgi:hypothetical protein
VRAGVTHIADEYADWSAPSVNTCQKVPTSSNLNPHLQSHSRLKDNHVRKVVVSSPHQDTARTIRNRAVKFAPRFLAVRLIAACKPGADPCFVHHDLVSHLNAYATASTRGRQQRGTLSAGVGSSERQEAAWRRGSAVDALLAEARHENPRPDVRP